MKLRIMTCNIRHGKGTDGIFERVSLLIDQIRMIVPILLFYLENVQKVWIWSKRMGKNRDIRPVPVFEYEERLV
ncbi:MULTISPECIES: hypothetical protein [Geobacillus]|nr:MULTISPECIES: hypothetical protein [Geobacillus]MED3716873.1 hypothetical protein [Geobacillus thermodenitrificans]MED4916118.1 hypothetical protein [Geobacillus thermodenitrificans]